MKILQPPGWKKPGGYSHGIMARGSVVCIAGQVGWDERGKIVSDDFVEQTRQTLKNIVSILRETDARNSDLVRMTWFVKDKKEYLASTKKIGEVYREIIGDHYPAMSLVQVSDLLEEGAKVEIEATAVIPE